MPHVVVFFNPVTPRRAALRVASLAGAGVLALMVEGIVFDHRLNVYRDTPTHDVQLYQRAKATERAMIATGVCVALATGITLLTIDQRERKFALRPGLAGLTLQGLF